MNERNLRVLEFPKIRARMAALATTEMGRACALELMPSSDPFLVRRMQQQTEEASTVLAYNGSNPMAAFTDVRPFLKLAQIGSTLSAKAILQIADAMKASRLVRNALVTDREDTPLLTELGSRLYANRRLEEDIFDAILSEDEISDHASSELADIRRHIRVLNDRIRDKLNSIVRSPSTVKYLMDAIITMRNGRYVVPVKAECRANVPGIVHDQSGTGSTLFIEPMSVVEAGNELKQWAVKEKNEIERILAAFSAQIGPDAELIGDSLENLAEIDMIFARAALGRSMNAVPPKLNEEGRVNLIRARHPLIDPDKVVPSNLWLGSDFTTLVITGPNTGGKTVTLKTVGLLSLMAQAGMQIPAAYGSELAIFDEIFADIGDEQSIEQSLSTFSSHMTNIVDILERVTENSLVLFDELGAGTDPTEGAALAMAILNRLLESKVRTMATTHYSELKVFALSTPGVENASVEFNVETLRPTYRLSIGVPGKSNAFEISRKLGLSQGIIDRAKELLSANDIRFEDVIAGAEYQRQVAQREREAAEQARAETIRLRNEAETLYREMEEKQKTAERKAKEEGRRIVENARREAENVIQELKRMKKEGAEGREAEINALRKRMQNNLDGLSEGLQGGASMAPAPKDLNVGDTVDILHLNTRGTVLSKPDAKGDVQLQAGIMKLKANLSQLRLVQEKKPKKQKSTVLVHSQAASRTVRMECDVRGMTLDEALIEVEKYLDEAVMAGMNEVCIVHGKGTGVLREEIQKYLRTIPGLTVSDEDVRNGGAGVTVVKL